MRVCKENDNYKIIKLTYKNVQNEFIFNMKIKEHINYYMNSIYVD